jgi:hypothetical protein
LKRRRDWFDGQLDLDPAKLVFIDETGLSTKMARLRGRAPRGERCRAGVPHGHWKTTFRFRCFGSRLASGSDIGTATTAGTNSDSGAGASVKG